MSAGASKPKGCNRIAQKSVNITYACGRRTLALINPFGTVNVNNKHI